MFPSVLQHSHGFHDASPFLDAGWSSSPPGLSPSDKLGRGRGSPSVRVYSVDVDSDDESLPITPHRSQDSQVVCYEGSQPLIPRSPDLLPKGTLPLCVTEDHVPIKPTQPVFTRIFQDTKVWIDMEDTSRKRQEVRQLLVIHGAELVYKPILASLFILDFQRGTPPGLLHVPGPVLHTSCRSFEWVHESIRLGVMVDLQRVTLRKMETELGALLRDYESSRPRRISSMVLKRSRYIDARLSPDSEDEVLESPVKIHVKVKQEVILPSTPCKSPIMSLKSSPPRTPCKPLSRLPKAERKLIRPNPLSPYFVKITRSESPPNVPVPSLRPGRWSKGAYDLATAGWHLAFYSRWSIEGIIGLLAKKYPHRTHAGWLRILDGTAHASVMAYRDAYVVDWEIEAREMPGSPISAKHRGQLVLLKTDKLRAQRKAERGMVDFLARTRLAAGRSPIDWRKFASRQTDVALRISSAFLDRQKLHLECKWHYREHRARLDCQALRVVRIQSDLTDDDTGSDGLGT